MTVSVYQMSAVVGVDIHPEEDTSFTKMLEYGLKNYMDQ